MCRRRHNVDNGTQFVRVHGNVVFAAPFIPLAPLIFPGVSPFYSFGGCGGGPIDYDGNYSLQADPAQGLVSANALCGGHPLQGVTVESNHQIDSLSQVPPGLLASAGLTPGYKVRLSPAPVPSPLPPFYLYPPL